MALQSKSLNNMWSEKDSLHPSIHNFLMNGAKTSRETLKVSTGVKIYMALVQTTEFYKC